MCTGQGIDLKKQRERQAYHGSPSNSHLYSEACLKALCAAGRGGREKARARRFKERARFAAFALILLRKTVHVEVHPILPICHVSTKSFSCLIVLGIYICICMMNSVL